MKSLYPRKKPGRIFAGGGFFEFRPREVDVPDADEEIELDGIQEIKNLRRPPKLIEETGE